MHIYNRSFKITEINLLYRVLYFKTLNKAHMGRCVHNSR